MLKAERPDVDKKRTDLLKLQGEFQLKLRQLEKALLQALNDSEGNILEDDHVIATLETLKREASEVTKKVEETDIIMEEVNGVTSKYTPLAQACSSVFFVMEQLGFIHHFYQFSLDFFMHIFNDILLENPNLEPIKDFDLRLEIIMRDLFDLSFSRCARSLLHVDHLAFALRLTQIKLRLSSEPLIDEREFDVLIGGSDGTVSGKTHPDASALVSAFGESVASDILQLSRLPIFSSLPSSISSNPTIWKKLLDDDTPAKSIQDILKLEKG